MRYINTKQIDSHLWEFEVHESMQTSWTARLDSGHLTIYRGINTRLKPAGEANCKGRSESETVGIAMQLVFNWAQIYHVCNEKLDPRWTILDDRLHMHLAQREMCGVDITRHSLEKVANGGDVSYID